MNAEEASQILDSRGFSHSLIEKIPEGANHFVFDVVLEDGNKAIARFVSGRQNGKDSLFGGILSRKREESNINLVRESGLPAPAVLFSSEEFMLVEKLPGLLWSTHMEKHNHAEDVFSRSLEQLGTCIARLQQNTSAEVFGDAEGVKVSEGFRDCFALRMLDVTAYRLQNGSGTFNCSEKEKLQSFFQEKLNESDNLPPVFVMTDMHPMNFLVGDNCTPTGFFDLEACQYAHPALEMYGIRLFLFNYYPGSESTGEESFFRGYHRAGGKYNHKLTENTRLETILGLLRLLELTVSYDGVKDGLRDKWSNRFRKLLLEGIETDRMNWKAAAGILREKTRQPEKTLRFES